MLRTLSELRSDGRFKLSVMFVRIIIADMQYFMFLITFSNFVVQLIL